MKARCRSRGWLLSGLWLFAGAAFAQSSGSLEQFFETESEGRRSDTERLENFTDQSERLDDGNSVRDTESEAARDAIDQGMELSDWGINTAMSARDLLEDWQSLDHAEADCGSAYTDTGAPEVPSSCGDDARCSACYERAVGALNFNRVYIERARCITAAHVKMANSAMAFGDSASGVHGVMGLSWQLGGKPQIQEAVAQLKQTYTRKAGEYLRLIEDSLRNLGRCEAQHFGQHDWYERFGWIYVNFMRARYASPPE